MKTIDERQRIAMEDSELYPPVDLTEWVDDKPATASIYIVWLESQLDGLHKCKTKLSDLTDEALASVREQAE